MLRHSSRPRGAIWAIATPALVAALLSATAHAAEPGPAKTPKIDCRALPPGAPIPPECRKSGPDADRDGIPDAYDRCPNAAEDLDGFEDADGCPDPDNDGDGLLDEEDGCPLEAEDRDGFKDADGCPEPDNDGDGVLDAADLCPLEPESFDGSGDGDGCPDLLMVSRRPEPEAPPPQRRAPERPPTLPVMPPQPAAPAHTPPARPTPPAIAPPPTAAPPPAAAPPVAAPVAAKNDPAPAAPPRCPDGAPPTAQGECLAHLDAHNIHISDTVQFAYGTDKLLEASHPTLDQVVDILDSHPSLRVMIVGHADARGNDTFNLRLSTQRAINVRAYLLQQSRDPQNLSRRLEAVGIGARQPLRDNQSAVGRSHNRRVEFLVTSDRPPRRPAQSPPTPHAPAARAARR